MKRPRRNLKRALVVGAVVAVGGSITVCTAIGPCSMIYFTPYETVEWKVTFDGEVNIACARQGLASERFVIEEANSAGQVINLRARALPEHDDELQLVVEPRAVQLEATWVVQHRPDAAGKAAIRAAMVDVLDGIARSCGSPRALTWRADCKMKPERFLGPCVAPLLP